MSLSLSLCEMGPPKPRLHGDGGFGGVINECEGLAHHLALWGCGQWMVVQIPWPGTRHPQRDWVGWSRVSRGSLPWRMVGGAVRSSPGYSTQWTQYRRHTQSFGHKSYLMAELGFCPGSSGGLWGSEMWPRLGKDSPPCFSQTHLPPGHPLW